MTVRHGNAPDIGGLRRALESRPDLLQRGPVFNGSAGAPRRVYELSREVIAFQRATKPLLPMIERLIDQPSLDDNERRYLRDVQNHALRVVEQADGFRRLLQNILRVNLRTLMARRRTVVERDASRQTR